MADCFRAARNGNRDDAWPPMSVNTTTCRPVELANDDEGLIAHGPQAGEGGAAVQRHGPASTVASVEHCSYTATGVTVDG